MAVVLHVIIKIHLDQWLDQVLFLFRSRSCYYLSGRLS